MSALFILQECDEPGFNEFLRYLRGRTKEEAFRLGYEMAATVTAMNPVPIKLKFEKVETAVES